ncbi:MAG: hypothetical protein FWD15_05405 [Alphaproteobacteria bacterium]|nr:hypothetical protein [Alphaproteobacteria bacterium]
MIKLFVALAMVVAIDASAQTHQRPGQAVSAPPPPPARTATPVQSSATDNQFTQQIRGAVGNCIVAINQSGRGLSIMLNNGAEYVGLVRNKGEADAAIKWISANSSCKQPPKGPRK